MAANYPVSEGLQFDSRNPVVHDQQEKIYVPNQNQYGVVPGAGGHHQEKMYTPNPNQHENATDRTEGIDVAKDEDKRYCGLPPKIFWIVFAVLLLTVVGGAVGGGVGGSLASKSSSKDSR